MNDQTNEQAEVAPASSFKAPFNFRMVREDNKKHDDTKADIIAAGFTCAPVEEPVLDAAGNEVAKKVVGFKRDSLIYHLPIISVEDYNQIDPNFVQLQLNSLLEDAVKKEFVDKYIAVADEQLAVMSAKFVIDNLASQRASAIPAELYKQFGEYVAATLEASGVKQATIAIIQEMVNKKFSDAVLGTYSRFSEQYDALLQKVISTLGADTVTQTQLDNYIPVAEALAKNLESWQEVQSASQELDLGF